MSRNKISEYGMGLAASTQGDVYSYGILLLEMITGRRPTDDKFVGDLDLHNYVNGALHERVSERVDPLLFLEGDENRNMTPGGKNINGSILVTGLEVLDLSKNKVAGQVPANLGDLTNLQLLNLGVNFFGNNSSRDLDFIASLTNCSDLRILSLSGNKFGGNMPRVMANLSNQLTKLFLAWGEINYFGKLQNLQHLRFDTNQFSGQIVSTLCNTTALYYLDLSFNHFQERLGQQITREFKLPQIELYLKRNMNPNDSTRSAFFCQKFSAKFFLSQLTASLVSLFASLLPEAFLSKPRKLLLSLYSPSALCFSHPFFSAAPLVVNLSHSYLYSPPFFFCFSLSPPDLQPSLSPSPFSLNEITLKFGVYNNVLMNC
ncbi:unnamed protein product [Coffea canephora]|uniref:DH200=94 genomic scaffold, scaffold_2600 n=1 Tax=Coffea canephora TaxID=49390 RepID=A0A068VKL9_COFCA|nr:unnamed protein product [Coffea canephora]